ncbi:MAG TPA: PAS domain-containing protein [Geobacteraceae bacterium]|nr:PAS domain-containing protein [Geobacteraceae bacterium]
MFRKYLDRLAVPVLLVDDAARVVVANTRACSQLAKEAEEIEGRTCGRVFDCSNAELPGGCGKTEFCRDCTVRQTIADTFVTGQCHENIPAVLDVAAGNDGVDCRLSISTWKAGEIVLLKIDRVMGSQDEKSETLG